MNRIYVSVALSIVMPAGFAAELPSSTSSEQVRLTGMKTTPSTSDTAPQKVEEIEVKASRDEQRSESVTIAQTVGQADIVRYGDTNLLDVLRRVPGIVVSGVSGTGRGEIRMRGLGGGFVRILVDGQPAPPNFSLDSLSPALVEKIEILPVASVALGTQAIGGTINIILKRANVKRQRQLNLALNENNGFVQPQVSGTLSQTVDNFSWLVSSSARQRKADEFYATTTIGRNPDLLEYRDQFNHDRAVNWNLSPRLNYKTANGSQLQWQAFFSGIRYTSSGFDTTRTPIGSSSRFGNDTYVSHGSRYTIRNNISWEQSISESTKIELKAGLTTSSEESSSDIAFIDGSMSVSDRQRLGKKNDNSVRTISLTSKTSIVQNHTLSAGIDCRQEVQDDSSSNLLNQISVLDAASLALNSDSKRYAIFVQDEWELNPKLSAYIGVRWENLRFDSLNSASQSIRYEKSILSPVLQSVWRPAGPDKYQFKLGLSRTWRPPELGQLTNGKSIAVNNTIANPDVAGNPDLRPQLATGLDLVYEYFLPNSGVVSVTAFTREIDNVVVQRRSLVDGRWLLKPENAGKAVSRGLELETKFRLNQLNSNWPAANIRLNLARYTSAIRSLPSPNNKIDGESPWSANLGFDYRFSSLPLTIGSSFVYTRNGVIRVSDVEENAKSDQRTLDAFLLWRVTSMTSVRFAASNLVRPDTVRETTFSQSTFFRQSTNRSPSYSAYRVVVEMKF